MTKILKPVIKSGGSRVIVLPHFWLSALEYKYGSIPKKVELEFNDEEIIIRPVYDDRAEVKSDE